MDWSSLMGGGSGGSAPGAGPSSAASSSISFGDQGSKMLLLVGIGAAVLVVVLALVTIGKK